MKKYAHILSLMFSFSLLVSCSALAQSNDDYVRNTKTIPDVTAGGWTHDPAEDVVEGEFVQEAYVKKNANNEPELFVFLQVRNRNGSREELFLKFGSKNVGRSALKVNGKWYVAKGPFYDRPNSDANNDFKVEVIKDAKDEVTAIRVSLETLDGLKSILINK